MKTIIAGGRDFASLAFMTKTMDAIVPQPTVVVSGTAKGADTTGELWAKTRNIPIERYPAEWNKYGKSAGYRRNELMASKATRLVAFWDGQSKGTKHMIDIATHMGLEIYIVHYDNSKP